MTPWQTNIIANMQKLETSNMPRAKKQRADAILVMDFGGYSTRVFYRDNRSPNSKPNVLVMEPHVGIINKEQAKSYTDANFTSSAPENLAWVAINKDCRAVGYLAASNANAHIGLSGLKYESAIYKALAAIWVVAYRLELGHRFSIALAVLLPPGEFNDGKQFFELLKASLEACETPTGTLLVKLTEIQAFQEGGGVCAMYCQKLEATFSHLVRAFVMVGYRNASVLVSHRGAIAKGKTSNLGMVRMAQLVLERTSDYDEARLTRAIATAGTIDLSRRHVFNLTRSRDLTNRHNEADRLLEAIKLARPEYAQRLIGWLDEVLPPDIDEIVFCGGTAEYLKPELRSHFSECAQSWHGEIEIPSELDPDNMGIRLADVYGLFEYFTAQLLPAQSPPVAPDLIVASDSRFQTLV
ncbi:MAG: ParM/StbA family protein [Oscillatoriaceae cyanobacterium Prado104]|jgi:hypothetical protein|nr:ParM/StbA family protein [Oscillatoriaceae cyanobacterium Prado104]